MTQKLVRTVLALGLGLAIAACGPSPSPTGGATAPAGQTPAPTSDPLGYPGITGTSVFRTPEVPALLPTPEPGRAVLGGALYSFTSEMLLPETLIYLTPGLGPENRDFPLTVAGPDDAKGDIRGQTNSDGQFIFTNVPPGNYYLVVATFTWSYGVAAAGEQAPMLIELQPDQAQSVGIVYVSWP